MKTFICLFGLLCWMQSSLLAQSIIDIGLYNFPVNSNRLEVRIRPTQTVTNGVYSAGIFTVRVPTASGVSITAPPSLNTLYGYTLQNQGTDGTYNYYIFAFVSIYSVNWNAGTAYPIAILQFNSSCGGIANFEIINNAWTAQYNGNYYQELNSLEAHNIIWQATATAPLSSGPPNISCSGNQSVATNNNLCSYTHTGADGNATGSAACPGSTINYALTGATTGNFGTLAGVVFNKALTTVTATITDNSNQTASCAFSVTVADTQSPTITAPAAVVAVANAAGCSATGVVLGTPVTADNCSGIAITNNAPGSFPPGATMVTWKVTDGAGLSATATQLVTVQTNLTAGLQLASPQICSGTATSLSFPVAGGAGPYTILYNNGGGNLTLNNYTSNLPITVSPAATTTYQLLQVTDASGCSISPGGVVTTLTIQPNPIVAHLLPPVTAVCAGAPVSFFADGLLPNASTTFTYTVNGQTTTATATTTASGNFTFPPVAYPAGLHNIVLTAVTVNGCTTNSSLVTSFAINAQSAACNLSVGGKAITETMIGLEDVYVDISGAGPGIPPYALSKLTTGLYSFLNVIPPTSNLIITPSKNDNPLNGVSTYDLVLISKHILGLDTLGSLYKMIAADATHSGSITTFDIVELRKLILGIYQTLPNSPSWRFMDASFVFPNPSNPFTVMLPETRAIQNMLTDHLQEDFIAIKIGDVNGSAIANAMSPAEERTAGSLVFAAADQFFAADEVFTVRFRAREKVQGYQFTMHLEDLEVVDILPGPGMQLHHFGLFDDALTTSFDGDQVGEFEVTFRARTAGQLSAKIGVSSRITPAEAYGGTNEKLDVVFHFQGDGLKIAGARFEVYQNQPNPFMDKTQIGFYLPVATKTTLSIFDEMGRLVFKRSADLEKGHNAFEIAGSLLGTSGNYYYKIETATDAAVRKMVRLQ